jgi:rod shape-determining protein MreD
VIGATALAALIMGGFAVLQSTLLDAVAIAGVIPDLTLVVLVYVAHKNGSMMGQLVGFLGGMALDFMSLSPLGLYALTGTIIGFLFGITRGKMFVDPIFMPIIMVVVATLIKGIVLALTGALFDISYVTPFLSSNYLIELAYSSLVAPVIFALLGIIVVLQADRRRGES